MHDKGTGGISREGSANGLAASHGPARGGGRNNLKSVPMLEEIVRDAKRLDGLVKKLEGLPPPPLPVRERFLLSSFPLHFNYVYREVGADDDTHSARGGKEMSPSPRQLVEEELKKRKSGLGGSGSVPSGGTEGGRATGFQDSPLTASGIATTGRESPKFGGAPAVPSPDAASGAGEWPGADGSGETDAVSPGAGSASLLCTFSLSQQNEGPADGEKKAQGSGGIGGVVVEKVPSFGDGGDEEGDGVDERPNGDGVPFPSSAWPSGNGAGGFGGAGQGVFKHGEEETPVARFGASGGVSADGPPAFMPPSAPMSRQGTSDFLAEALASGGTISSSPPVGAPIVPPVRLQQGGTLRGGGSVVGAPAQKEKEKSDTPLVTPRGPPELLPKEKSAAGDAATEKVQGPGRPRQRPEVQPPTRSHPPRSSQKQPPHPRGSNPPPRVPRPPHSTSASAAIQTTATRQNHHLTQTVPRQQHKDRRERDRPRNATTAAAENSHHAGPGSPTSLSASLSHKSFIQSTAGGGGKFQQQGTKNSGSAQSQQQSSGGTRGAGGERTAGSGWGSRIRTGSLPATAVRMRNANAGENQRGGIARERDRTERTKAKGRETSTGRPEPTRGGATSGGSGEGLTQPRRATGTFPASGSGTALGNSNASGGGTAGLSGSGRPPLRSRGSRASRSSRASCPPPPVSARRQTSTATVGGEDDRLVGGDAQSSSAKESRAKAAGRGNSKDCLQNKDKGGKGREEGNAGAPVPLLTTAVSFSESAGVSVGPLAESHPQHQSAVTTFSRRPPTPDFASPDPDDSPPSIAPISSGVGGQMRRGLTEEDRTPASFEPPGASRPSGGGLMWSTSSAPVVPTAPFPSPNGTQQAHPVALSYPPPPSASTGQGTGGMGQRPSDRSGWKLWRAASGGSTESINAAQPGPAPAPAGSPVPCQALPGPPRSSPGSVTVSMPISAPSPFHASHFHMQAAAGQSAGGGGGGANGGGPPQFGSYASGAVQGGQAGGPSGSPPLAQTAAAVSLAGVGTGQATGSRMAVSGGGGFQGGLGVVSFHQQQQPQDDEGVSAGPLPSAATEGASHLSFGPPPR
uniref:Uncharacterized protein n=1 Tax=Chromera velia CCMP2878 TaxID=1169474 RepID=A0A0G4HK89_9ALVE|eukprot:Cvel_28470.t1-p1 / transcript=Cvel_28470.t1 / gene=Cvel_28470 / organism=Chromera_velia_CCMP2878 / gene_product=hypothetical protein / transcript_product=hypothetical protein / location=Cvel_scaffold3733:10321-13880(+) / protein_length=1082 / sequence_SO=supercontig / SO=protein_coding / is_pseudo=false